MKSFEEFQEEMMTAGADGFTGAASAEGPRAGYDPVMGGMHRRGKKKKKGGKDIKSDWISYLTRGKNGRKKKKKTPKNCGCGQNPCITYGKKKHDCASKVKHEQYGIGNCIKEMHDIDENGNVAHYDVFFNHGIEKNVPVSSLDILVTEMHEHVIHEGKKKFKPHKMIDPKTKKEYWADTYEKHLKYKKMGYVH